MTRNEHTFSGSRNFSSAFVHGNKVPNYLSPWWKRVPPSPMVTALCPLNMHPTNGLRSLERAQVSGVWLQTALSALSGDMHKASSHSPCCPVEMIHIVEGEKENERERGRERGRKITVGCISPGSLSAPVLPHLHHDRSRGRLLSGSLSWHYTVVWDVRSPRGERRNT